MKKGSRILGVCHCGKASRASNQAYCLDHHADYLKRWRASRGGAHAYLDGEARMKMNARAYLRVYVRRGLVSKAPCEVCGSRNVIALHQDYSQPLAARWLCKQHHHEFRKQRANV